MPTFIVLFLAGVVQDALITAYTRAVAVRARGAAAIVAGITTVASFLLYRETLFSSDGVARLLSIAAGNAVGTWILLAMDGRWKRGLAAVRRMGERARQALRRAFVGEAVQAAIPVRRGDRVPQVVFNIARVPEVFAARPTAQAENRVTRTMGHPARPHGVSWIASWAAPESEPESLPRAEKARPRATWSAA